ncbi:MAG: hypothetical protein JMN24_07645 [gamma proteobacterium endosymbiont of Lamellibrachia anaximandri]|nr:hypothetical protein [gamma proteobacterium endosymbiont of Lamellibrachia anaximandri]MBL3618199.1 hypothetical protein [gamma proteobacterium endosymbiont of Lamellibrachia anaximandri]
MHDIFTKAICSFCLFVWTVIALPEAVAEQETPGYTTSASCKACHEAAYAAWSDSHHSWAWRAPTGANVLGDFDNAEFEHQGERFRFETEESGYSVDITGPGNRSTRYPVHSTVGVTPLQQYLVEVEPGRTQALDVAWDTEKQRWYHLYPDADTSVGNGLHWSGSYKNWNSHCAECHATAYEKHYDPLKDEYHSTQTEIGVGCEACHGPGEAHIEWAATPDSFNPSRWRNVGKLGLLHTFAEGQVNLCAPCHSRREPLGADSPPPGADFNDHYRLALLSDNLYFPDGQIRDEVYVYGSFLQSRMHARGVVCSNCHEPHGVKLKTQGNALCTQCHNPAGNPAFPTLIKRDYDHPDHYFHKPGSDGADCRNCHMPERNYMVVDGRRDHSFRIPRPSLSAKTASPDPCTQCHEDKTTAWADGEIGARFPQRKSREPHFAELFTSTATLDTKKLAELATDEEIPAIVRASAVRRLAAVSTDIADDALTALSKDQSALVQAESVALHRTMPTAQRAQHLAPLLNDPAQSVRIQAAKEFLGINPHQVPEDARIPLRRAMSELQRSLLAKADFPETQMVIGGVALTQRNLEAAYTAFSRAVEMDPQLIPAWRMLAKIQSVRSDQSAVAATLREAIRHNSDNVELELSLRRLLGAGSQ